MVRRALTLSIVIVLLASTVTLEVGRAEPGNPGSFTQTPFRIGDAANYSATVFGNAENESYHVLPLDHALTRNRTTVGALPVERWLTVVNQTSVGIIRLSTGSGLIAQVVFPCPAQYQNGTCAPHWVAYDWGAADQPLLLGTSLLAGRTITLGTSWNESLPCTQCASHLRVSITAPPSNSPPGTDYAATIHAIGIPSPWYPVTLDMSTSFAFPLQITSSHDNATLLAFHTGTQTVPFGHARTRSPPAEAPQPFQGGLPRDGAPLSGYPSLSTARRATKDPGLQANETLANLRFFRTGTWRSTYVGDITASIVDDYTFTTTTPEGNDRTIDLKGTETTSPALGLTLLPESWARTNTPGTGATTGPYCLDASVPMWDAVRLANATGWLSAFTGFTFGNCGDAFYWTVYGGQHGTPFQEFVSIDATDGNLWDAFVWTRS